MYDKIHYNKKIIIIKKINKKDLKNKKPKTKKKERKKERDTYTPTFIAALFIIARTWKQPRCPSADEWIRMLWYIYTMEYYSAI